MIRVSAGFVERHHPSGPVLCREANMPQGSDVSLEKVWIREAVGLLLHSRKALDTLILRLTRAGFESSDVALLASRDAIVQKFGTMVFDPLQVADRSDAPRRDAPTADTKTPAAALVFSSLVAIGCLAALIPLLATSRTIAFAILAALAGGSAAAASAKVIRNRFAIAPEAADFELNRLACVMEAMRFALEALACAAPDWLKAHAHPGWVERYEHHSLSAKRPLRSEAKRAVLAQTIGADGHRLLSAVQDPDAPYWLRQIPAVEIVRRVWVQQFTMQDDAVHWRSSDDTPPATLLLNSPHDLDANSARTETISWVG
jgi:hypothetical protein